MEKFEKIIKLMNNFELIPGKITEISRFSDSDLFIYERYDSGKHYFFHFIKEQTLKYHLKKVENCILKKFGKDFIPQDSYLILFYETEKITNQFLKEVIDIEENEFLFKKYVFYYTKDELTEAEARSSKFSLLDDFWEFLSDSSEDNLTENFFLRLAIKVPIISLNFEARNLQEFEDIFNKKVKGLRSLNDDMIIELNSNIEKDMADINLTSSLEPSKIIATNLLREIYGGDFDEYLSE